MARGMAPEEPLHLLGRLQVPLGAGEAMEAQLLDGAAEADGGDDVLQRPPLGHVIVHVVGGDEAHAHPGREIVEIGEALRHRRRGTASSRRGSSGRRRGAASWRRRSWKAGSSSFSRRQDDGEDVLGEFREVVEGEIALALGGAAIALASAAATAACSPRGSSDRRAGNNRRCVSMSRADQQLDARQMLAAFLPVKILHRRIGAHDAGQRVAVGDADRGVAAARSPARPARRDASRCAGSCSWS